MKRLADKRAIDILTLFNIFDLDPIGRLLGQFNRPVHRILVFVEITERASSIEGFEKKGGCRR